MEETERRQGLSAGLLHVSDNVFGFFLTVEEERQKLHTFSSLQKHKSKVLAHATSDLRRNESIKSNMIKMFEGMEGMHEDIVIEVANDILDSHLRVCNNEFRTYLKTKMGKKKTYELRKMIKQGKVQLPKQRRVKKRFL